MNAVTGTHRERDFLRALSAVPMPYRGQCGPAVTPPPRDLRDWPAFEFRVAAFADLPPCDGVAAEPAAAYFPEVDPVPQGTS